MNVNKIAIICGGTGGHFYPGLTLARIFQHNGVDVCLFVGGHKTENQKLEAAKFGIKILEIASAKISKSPIQLLKFSIKLLVGFFQARKELLKFNPDAVLAMGSFTSVPMSLAAVSVRIPLFLHDGNARIGKANIFLSRFAKLIMTSFPPVNNRSLKCPYIFTGMPLRPEILNGKITKKDAINEINKLFRLNFCLSKYTILIFGGSQGAATLNKTLPEALAGLDNNEIQVIHLIGNHGKKDELYKNARFDYFVVESCSEMAALYSASDLVICRSGGSTVAELAFFEKQSILIPFPNATNLHQNDNAKFYEKSGISRTVFNVDCTIENMTEIIGKYIKKNSSITSLSQCSAKPNAAQDILDIISTQHLTLNT